MELIVNNIAIAMTVTVMELKDVQMTLVVTKGMMGWSVEVYMPIL